MNSYDFLEAVCREVKYKSIHNSIKQELGAHIEENAENYRSSGMERDRAVETAVAHMGNAKEIGRMFDKQYRMPFNNRFGLSIWAALVTMVIYAAYPFLYSFWKSREATSVYVDFLIIGIILLFIAINALYLRRGRKIVTVRDMARVTAGFVTGYILSAAILISASRFTVTLQYPYPHYAYMPEVRLLFAPPYIPLLPINLNAFAMQGFCWWLCIVAYVAAVKSTKKIKTIMIWNSFMTNNGRMIFDFDEFTEGYDSEGKHIKDVGSIAFGWNVDKYGERVKDKRSSDDISD